VKDPSSSFKLLPILRSSRRSDRFAKPSVLYCDYSRLGPQQWPCSAIPGLTWLLDELLRSIISGCAQAVRKMRPRSELLAHLGRPMGERTNDSFHPTQPILNAGLDGRVGALRPVPAAKSERQLSVVKATFAGMGGKEEDAPIPGVRMPAGERVKSTLNRPSCPRPKAHRKRSSTYQTPAARKSSSWR